MISLIGNDSTFAYARLLLLLIGQFLSMTRTRLGNTGLVALRDEDSLTQVFTCFSKRVRHVVSEYCSVELESFP